MALPIISGVFRCSLHWTGPGGQHAVNVIHVQRAATTAATIATTIDTNVTAAMWNQTIPTASVDQLAVTPLEGTSATFLLATSGAKWTGNGSGTDFIPQGSGIVSLRTALRGRSYRGRVFTPFLPEANQSQGAIVLNLAAWTAAWVAFIAALGAGTTPLVIASYKHSTAAAVTSAIGETEIATQRRRQERNR